MMYGIDETDVDSVAQGVVSFAIDDASVVHCIVDRAQDNRIAKDDRVVGTS